MTNIPDDILMDHMSTYEVHEELETVDALDLAAEPEWSNDIQHYVLKDHMHTYDVLQEMKMVTTPESSL